MGKTPHILVVEDDADVAAYLRIVLEKRGGFQVTHTIDPLEALRWLASSSVDLVLTDIELPGMTGLRMAAQIRDGDPHLPILVMTAHPSVDYAVTALRNQVDEFMLKPVPGRDLLAAVHRLVELGRSRRDKDAGTVVLAIGAHPDDVEIGVGGLLAAHRAAGDKVVILTLSRGARGGEVDSREHESLAAAEILGARLFLEDLEDTRISDVDPTVGIIERVVAEVSPTVVYTHSVHDRHQDHRAVHQAASVATRRARRSPASRVPRERSTSSRTGSCRSTASRTPNLLCSRPSRPRPRCATTSSPISCWPPPVTGPASVAAAAPNLWRSCGTPPA